MKQFYRAPAVLRAVVVLVVMLTCAALSERIVPGVATQEAGTHTPMMAADTTVVKTTLVEDEEAAVETPRELTPRVPEYLVMLLVGSVLLGLGGAFRPSRRDR